MEFPELFTSIITKGWVLDLSNIDKVLMQADMTDFDTYGATGSLSG